MHFDVHLKLPHSVVSDKLVSVANEQTWWFGNITRRNCYFNFGQIGTYRNNHLHREEINHYGTICLKKWRTRGSTALARSAKLNSQPRTKIQEGKEGVNQTGQERSGWTFFEDLDLNDRNARVNQRSHQFQRICRNARSPTRSADRSRICSKQYRTCIDH